MLSEVKMKMLMAQAVILRQDEAQDVRPLSSADSWLRGKLKQRVMGWAVIEKARKKQCSRVMYLREGDANTRFFHLKANGKCRKNFIQRLRKDSGWLVSHNDKHQVIQEHF